MKRTDLEIFLSLDWGWNAPGCVLWWVALVDSHYHIAAELKFQRTAVETLGAEVWKRNKDLGFGRMRYVVADPACWQHTGAGKGESIAESLSRPPCRLPMKKGDNNRLLGWARVHELFQPAPDGRPWVTVDESCTYLRRTIPAAVSDKSDPDDVDTTGDDHGLDALRYGAMSRPAPSRLMRTLSYPKKSAGALFQQAVQAAAVA
jgi:hypothetical protein